MSPRHAITDGVVEFLQWLGLLQDRQLPPDSIQNSPLFLYPSRDSFRHTTGVWRKQVHHLGGRNATFRFQPERRCLWGQNLAIGESACPG